MSGCATEIHQTTFGEHVKAVASREGVLVDLRLDVGAHDAFGFVQAIDLNLVVEVTNVTNDGLILHLLHVLEADDVLVAGRGHINVTPAQRVFNRKHAESFHRSLQGADRVNLGHHNLRTLSTECLGTTLADIAVTADDTDLAGNHHIGRALDAVDQRLAATVEVVELRLGHRVIHIDRRYQQRAGVGHLIETMHTGSGFFGNTLPVGNDLVENTRLLALDVLKQILDHLLFLAARRSADPVGSVLHFIALVNEQSRIATVINDQLRTKALRVHQRLPGAPPIFFERLTLPRKYRNARRRDRRRRMILRRENVAGNPAHFGTEVDQRLNENRRLNRHVQRTHDAHTLKRLFFAVLLARRHQARHLMLGNFNFLASEIGKTDVAYFVIVEAHIFSFKCLVFSFKNGGCLPFSGGLESIGSNPAALRIFLWTQRSSRGTFLRPKGRVA